MARGKHHNCDSGQEVQVQLIPTDLQCSSTRAPRSVRQRTSIVGLLRMICYLPIAHNYSRLTPHSLLLAHLRRIHKV